MLAPPTQAGISVAVQRRTWTPREEARSGLKPPQCGARVCALSAQTGHAQLASFSACGRTSCSGGVCGFQAVGCGGDRGRGKEPGNLHSEQRNRQPVGHSDRGPSLQMSYCPARRANTDAYRSSLNWGLSGRNKMISLKELSSRSQRRYMHLIC